MPNSWLPSLLNIIQASVWQRILAYQSTIIPSLLPRRSLYMDIIMGQLAHALIGPEGNGRRLAGSSWRSSCTPLGTLHPGKKLVSAHHYCKLQDLQMLTA